MVVQWGEGGGEGGAWEEDRKCSQYNVKREVCVGMYVNGCVIFG